MSRDLFDLVYTALVVAAVAAVPGSIAAVVIAELWRRR